MKLSPPLITYLTLMMEMFSARAMGKDESEILGRMDCHWLRLSGKEIGAVNAISKALGKVARKE